MEELFCQDCSSHFIRLRPSVKEVLVTKHFSRDMKNQKERENIIANILDNNHLDFTELHKFEENLDGIMIFRAKNNSHHIVYCIYEGKLIFLRMIKNFEEYRKFLDDKKEIKRMIESLNLERFKLQSS
jgi:hypothetical protein